MEHMTREEALKIDRGHGAHSDLGGADGLFCVWGAKSGFCYGAYPDISQASDAGCDLHEALTLAA